MPNALFNVLFTKAWVWVGGMTDDKAGTVVEEKSHNRCKEKTCPKERGIKITRKSVFLKRTCKKLD